MSKENLFDEISRILASGISRRRAFRLIAGVVAGGTAVSVLEPRAFACGGSVVCGADSGSGCVASVCTCDAPMTCSPSGVFNYCTCQCPTSLCNGICCQSSQTCINNMCCDSTQACNGVCCASSQTCISDTCCDTTQVCDGVCCPDGQTCISDACCDAAQVCDGTCCPDGQSCVNGSCQEPNSAVLRLTSTKSGPPMEVGLTIQDTVNGISGLKIREAVNCKITPTMPMAVAASGTMSPVALAASKISHCKHAVITIGVIDQHGKKEETNQLILTHLKLSTGKSVRQTFSALHRGTRNVTLTNGSLGLTTLEVWINSTLQNTVSLTNNQTLNLKLPSPPMILGDNTVSFVGFGPLGAGATIMVKDNPLYDTNPDPPIPSMEGFPPAKNVWGPLTEETEDNSDLHVASVATQSIHLNFAGTLNSNVSSNPSTFTVQNENGEAAIVQTATVQAGAAGSTNLMLQLPSGSLQSGVAAYVSWQNLASAGGQAMSGFVELSPQ